MKKIVSMALSLLLISSIYTAFASDPKESSEYNNGYVDAIVHGTPLSSHEFLLYYIVRAHKFGVDIKAYSDVMIDTGSIISLKYVTLSTDDKNGVKYAFFSLPDEGDADFNESMRYLVSFVYAFDRAPSTDYFYDQVGKGCLDTATADIQAIYASTKEDPFRMENYAFYYSDRTVTAEFFRR